MNIFRDLYYEMDSSTSALIPLMLSPVAAGFPSPAEDFIEKRIDLNRELIDHPAATFFIRVKGDSMIDAGIDDNDILIVDRAVRAYDECLAVCCLDGQHLVKEVHMKNGGITLVPANRNYAVIKVQPEQDFFIAGIVNCIIKDRRRKGVRLN